MIKDKQTKKQSVVMKLLEVSNSNKEQNKNKKNSKQKLAIPSHIPTID